MINLISSNKPEEVASSIPPTPPVASIHKTRRPTIVSVVAVALLVIAGCCSIEVVCNINASYLSIIALILCAFMGVGLLRLVPWARKGTIFTLILLFILAFAHGAWTVSEPIKWLLTPNPPASDDASLMTISMLTIVILAVIGYIICLVIIGLIIIVLTRPNVVEAFQTRE